MTIENISNVPDVSSGMLRIAPRAQQIQIQTPLRTFPRHIVPPDSPPPLGKNPGFVFEITYDC